MNDSILMVILHESGHEILTEVGHPLTWLGYFHISKSKPLFNETLCLHCIYTSIKYSKIML